MSQNITPQGEHDTAAESRDPAALSPSQSAALEKLSQGDTLTAAAQAAGVAQETVHRWLRQDFAFQTALNRFRAELREATERRLLVIAHSAANSLNDKVEGAIPGRFSRAFDADLSSSPELSSQANVN
jgi:hypothetical protein